MTVESVPYIPHDTMVLVEPVDVSPEVLAMPEQATMEVFDGKDKEAVQALVDGAYGVVFSDDEARAKRLAMRRIQQGATS